MAITANHGQATSGAAVGIRICAGFGLAWMIWGSAGLPMAARLPIVLGSIVATLATFVTSRRIQGGAKPEFGTSYWRIVAAEGAAIGIGLAIIDGGFAAPQANAAWIATVTGVHFLGLASIWPEARFSVLAALLVASGVAGFIAVGTGAGVATATAVAALPAGLSLLSRAAVGASDRG